MNRESRSRRKQPKPIASRLVRCSAAASLVRTSMNPSRAGSSCMRWPSTALVGTRADFVNTIRYSGIGCSHGSSRWVSYPKRYFMEFLQTIQHVAQKTLYLQSTLSPTVHSASLECSALKTMVNSVGIHFKLAISISINAKRFSHGTYLLKTQALCYLTNFLQCNIERGYPANCRVCGLM